MRLFSDIEELSQILDEHIEKALPLEDKSKIQKLEEDLAKSLSFNPMEPVNIDPSNDWEYYNPYRWAGDGYVPYTSDHWAGVGKKADNYLTTDLFYRKYVPVEKSLAKLKSLGRLVQADLVKAGAAPVGGGGMGQSNRGAPIGTVHRYADGQDYKKVSAGEWVPVAGLEHRKTAKWLEHPDPKVRQQAGAQIDAHHAQVEKLKQAIKEKEKAESAKHSAVKEAVNKMREVHQKLYDGPMPKEVSDHFDKLTKEDPAVMKRKLFEKIKRKGKGQGKEVKLSSDEVEHLLKEGKYALISAGKNPAIAEDMGLSDQEIKARHEKLKAELIDKGYAFTPVKGHYGGEEDSFLVMVHDHDPEHIKQLGKKFNQDSVILSDKGKHELHFTTGDKAGKMHKGEGLDPKGATAEDNYTQIKTEDGKPLKFSLGINFDQLHDAQQSTTVKKKHKVSVKLKFQGKEYNKDYDVEAGSHGEAVQKIIDGIDKKLPGAQIESISAKTQKEEKVLAPADKGRPDNGLKPPPPANQKFIKPGGEVTEKDSQEFLKAFREDFSKSGEQLKNDLLSAGASHYANRLKDAKSLTKKMNGRLKDRSLNTVTDAIGARALCNSSADQQKVLKMLQTKYDLVEQDDFTENGRPDGYRAIHVLFKTPSGKIGELQIKTHRQQAFATYTHDSIYKGDPKIKNDPEVNKFTVALSDYLYNLDKGMKDDPAKRPKEPKVLLDNDMKFDWNSVSEETINKSEKGLKHFVVVRHPKTKEVLETHEHPNAESAFEHHDKLQKYHDGEVVVGHARSIEEFHRVFGEYQPKKKGPGSRGGQIVGRTKSGKAVYASQKKKRGKK